ncbi:MAG: sodium:calcium antiporter [Mariprofundaceae bacterium]|nr:sodium:calcium antiporter [Mariprofundaceae bacterium]
MWDRGQDTAYLFDKSEQITLETTFILLGALIIIFFAAELFTNALEVLGERMGFSEGVTGSIFAAVGTAMPETIVPMVAILAGGSTLAVNHAVGMGAILGAPFMLGTLSIGMIGFFAGLKRGWFTPLVPEVTGFQRDIKVFLMAYTLVIVVALLPEAWHLARLLAAVILFIMYAMYVMITIRASKALVEEGHGTEADGDLYFKRFLGDSTPIVVLQLIIALITLVLGAKIFVHGIEIASTLFSVAALVLSLLIVPLATELPEKVNSILWIRKGRDTLAFGNITGAMVFQGTVIPGIGMLLLPWSFHDEYAGLAVILALMGSSWLWFLQRSGRLNGSMMMLSSLLYAAFIAYVIWV